MLGSPEMRQVRTELDDAERDARKLADGLSDKDGTWREKEGSWSVSECLDHLAITNLVYLAAIRQAAVGSINEPPARRFGLRVPQYAGRWFVRSLEPPVRVVRTTAPRSIQPRLAPPLSEALAAFLSSQQQIFAFLRANTNLAFAEIYFQNPFIKRLSFKLTTGLQIIAAHERRHLWQAWRVRSALGESKR